MKKALITGITGQDGSYLTELLLEKDYEVHGIIRRSSSFNTGRIDHLYNDPEILNKKLFLHYGDLVDTSNMNRLLEKIEPDEIYNLAAQSHVKVSFEVPDYTAQVDALGTLRFLDAIREVGLRKVKFYQASTSELYGKARDPPVRMRIVPATSSACCGFVLPIPTFPVAASMNHSTLIGNSLPSAGIEDASRPQAPVAWSIRRSAHRTATALRSPGEIDGPGTGICPRAGSAASITRARAARPTGERKRACRGAMGCFTVVFLGFGSIRSRCVS